MITFGQLLDAITRIDDEYQTVVQWQLHMSAVHALTRERYRVRRRLVRMIERRVNGGAGQKCGAPRP